MRGVPVQGVVPDASQETLSNFAKQTVEPASTIRTDDWSGYGTLPDVGFGHIVVPSHELKIAHLGISLLKRWLGGTHQGAVSHEHLAYYLDEYTFRFNRRRADHRGLLFYRILQNAVQIEPTTYRQMVRHVRGPKTSKHATTQDASRDGRNRWTTTATTTDNEENSEFVHRSRRRSRPPTCNPEQLPKHNI